MVGIGYQIASGLHPATESDKELPVPVTRCHDPDICQTPKRPDEIKRDRQRGWLLEYFGMSNDTQSPA